MLFMHVAIELHCHKNIRNERRDVLSLWTNMTSIADVGCIGEEGKSRLRYTIGRSLKSEYMLNGKSLTQVGILSRKKI